MSTAFAREIASQIHQRAIFVDHRVCDLAAQLRDIAATKVADIKADFSTWRLDVLAEYGFEPGEQRKPYAYSQGVAVIPVHGMLVNRLNFSAPFATGYGFIRSQMRAALADPDVEHIVYDIDSNGGLVSGCPELAADIFASRSIKPSTAVVDARCYSAAYYIGSAASRVVCTPSGGVGSIGVAAVHADISGALEQDGVKITLIHKGDLKVDGSQFQPLSERARESIEKDMTHHYDLFVGAVARHRGISESDVRKTEAGCFQAGEALALGLIDDVKTPTEALSEFNIVSESGAAMEFTAEQIREIATTAAREAVDADRARLSAIRTCAEAAGREKLADHLALGTGMSVEAARAVLAAAPQQAEETATHKPAPSAFAAVMDRSEHPNVGADDPDNTEGGGVSDDPRARVSRLMTDYVAATGRKVLPMRGAA